MGNNPFRHQVNYCLQAAGQALAMPLALPGAAEEAALFFLWRAWRLYLRELAWQLNLPDADFPTAGALAGAGGQGEAVDELQVLERDGWLADLCTAWRACQYPRVSVEPPPRPIARTAAAAGPADWQACLQALLERQRLLAAEW